MKQAERMRVFKSMHATSRGCDGRYPAFDILHIRTPCLAAELSMMVGFIKREKNY
tara:strand:- start:227 stop:391 length:165 start_codon:yes stop_codon:yes gene_type:complete